MANDYNRISAAQYAATKRREGTRDWTREDDRVQAAWLTQLAIWKGSAEEVDDESTVEDEEVETSPGNSSSVSDSKPETNSDNSLDSGLSLVPTTENPSEKDRTDTSSVSRTAGTKGNTEGKARK